MTETIVVIYSCAECDLLDTKVSVPARGPDEDVVHWFEKVMIVAVAKDHRTKRPRCSSHMMRAIKVPIDDGGRIGDPRGH